MYFTCTRYAFFIFPEGNYFFAAKRLYAYYSDRALIAFSMAMTDTPTSANTASHILAAPAAPIKSTTALTHMMGTGNAGIASWFETWNTGKLKSYLIEITADILRHKGKTIRR